MNEQNHDMNELDVRREAPQDSGYYDDRPPAGDKGAPPPRYRGRAGLPYKSPVLAGFLSTFCGLGHVYLGYIRQGMIHAGLFAAIITGLAVIDIDGVDVILGLSLGFLWFYNMIDAIRRASLINRALDGLGDEKLPEDYQLPGQGGSMIGGVVLVVIGALIVLDQNFDIDMRWLEDWWALGLVGLGGYLIFKSRKEKARRG